ncbi:MAG: hypothetical protein EKK55_25040 [Rhodocyclaceae bacterium]|nr:MAG: hypothetical protein EKK55_25040 [Rhodocyclaceae bacterium]
MAVPTIASVTPPFGWTLGGSVVEIAGTGFKLPPPPPTAQSAPLPAPPPTVQVLFDGVPAPRVWVASATLIRCLPPPHAANRWVFRFDDKDLPGKPNADVPEGATLVQVANGTVDVSVTNLQPDGAAVAGETVTAEEAFTYRRPRLDRPGAWLNARDAFLEELRIHVLENVVTSANVDYDPETGDPQGLIGLATLPGIAVTQLAFPKSKDQRGSGQELVASDAGDKFFVRRRPIFHDMTCVLLLAAESDVELFDMAEDLALYFEHSKGLIVPIDPAGGDHGNLSCRYIVDAAGVQFQGRLGRGNVETATLTVMVRTVPLDSVPGVDPDPLPGEPGWVGHEGMVGVTRRAQRLDFRAYRK